jgi:ABC-type enterochelin transport system permease subunit
MIVTRAAIAGRADESVPTTVAIDTASPTTLVVCDICSRAIIIPFVQKVSSPLQVGLVTFLAVVSLERQEEKVDHLPCVYPTLPIRPT